MMRFGSAPRLALAGCLLALLAPTAPAAPTTAPPRKVLTLEGITEYRLDNGLRLLLFPDPSTPKVTVNLTVFVGSRHEGYGETGMAHLLEHMLFKGTPTHRDIPKALRDHGARPYNGTTWFDRTNYYETLNASDENLEFAIRLEADRLVNSFVKREDLASEMTVVRSEFESGENNPQGILRQRLLAVAYEWHNYGKSTIGNRSDIERVPIDSLKAFYRRFYQPDNALVVVAGNFKPDKALALVAKYFGPLKKPTRKLDPTYTEEPPQDGERSVLLRRVGSVATVGAVYHIPAAAHPDYAPLDVLTNILDTEPTGRLFKALVATKKSSRVSAFTFGLHDPGVLVVQADVDPASTPQGARDTMLDTLERLAETKITPAEVERSKAKLEKDRAQLITSSNRVGTELSEWAAMGDWRLFFLHRQRVAKVTADDVTRVARHYLKRSNRTAGMFVPTKEPLRASIPATPDVEALVKDLKGGEKLAAGEAFDPTPANIEKRVTRSVLSGGVKAAVLPRKTRGETVNVLLVLHYGNPDSFKGLTSATQLLASLMMRGTKKHNRQELEDEFDRLKAEVNASGQLGNLTITVKCKRDKLPAVLALLREVLREPTFPATEFDTLKRQSRASLERGKTDPQSLALRALRRHLSPFPPDHIRYVPTVEESLKRLDAVTLADVRTLYAQLGGQNGEFVVVGDFDPATTLKLMDDALKDWKPGVPFRRIERPAVLGVKGARVVIDTPDKANAIYLAALNLPLTDSNPDYAALEVGDFLFGGGALSSRLGNRVRQKEGLSYGVGSHFNADARDKAATFLMFAICNPKNIDKVDKAILEEIAKMRGDGVKPKELNEAKDAYVKQLKAARGSDGSLAALLQDGLFLGRTMTWYAELEKKVEGLTPEAVNSAFRNHIDPKKLVIIRAGDFKKKKE